MEIRKILAGAALSVPLAAAAQSVTLYGVFDTGVEYVNNIGPSKDGVARVPVLTATVPSRWGLRGSEDLGGYLDNFNRTIDGSTHLLGNHYLS